MKLADVLKLKDAPVAGVLEDYSKKASLITALDVIECPGTSFEAPYITETEGSVFRAENTGVDFATGGTANTLISLKFLDFGITEDVQVAQSYVGGVEAYMAMRQEQKVVGMLQGLEKQILLGQEYADSDGFKGIGDYFTTAQGIDCEASGGSWAFGLNTTRIKLVLGKGGSIESGDLEKVKITDGDGKPYDAYSIAGGCWIGAYILGSNAFRVAANIGTSFDDETLAALLDRFALGLEANMFVLSKKVHGLLRDSRTATNPTGAPAPYPSEAFGVPIVLSNGVRDNMPYIDFA